MVFLWIICHCNQKIATTFLIFLCLTQNFALILCRSGSPLMKNSLRKIPNGYVNWLQLLTVFNWSLWLTSLVGHLLEWLKERHLRRYARLFICLMTSLRYLFYLVSFSSFINNLILGLLFTVNLFQEEKLEPLKNTTDDPRIRLLNRLYAKKRKELKERQKLKVIATPLLQIVVLATVL